MDWRSRITVEPGKPSEPRLHRIARLFVEPDAEEARDGLDR